MLHCVSLPDDRLQLFRRDAGNLTYSAWKVDTTPDAGWTPWSGFDTGRVSDGNFRLTQITSSVRLPNRMPQLFGQRIPIMHEQKQTEMVTRWKESLDPRSAWLDWSVFRERNSNWTDEPNPQANITGRDIVVLGYNGRDGIDILAKRHKSDAPDLPLIDDYHPAVTIKRSAEHLSITNICRLNDGGLQVFANSSYGVTVTSYMLDTDRPRSWSDPTDFDDKISKQVTSCQLRDGRPQLFGIYQDGSLWTAFKGDTAPGARWYINPFETPRKVKDIACGVLPDGRVQIFADFDDQTGSIYTCWKEATDPDSRWTAWGQLEIPS